jgi:ribosomal-protein-alanine N-acetyltransferase
MDWTIRPWLLEDFEALCRLDQECYAPEVAYSRRTMRSFLRLPGAECFVAEARGQIAGFILTDRDGPSGHIITIDVAASHRRRKLGTALLLAAEAALTAAGVRDVDLEASTSNEAAVAFWQEHGYRACGILEDYYATGEDAYWMAKSLPRPAAAGTT